MGSNKWTVSESPRGVALAVGALAFGLLGSPTAGSPDGERAVRRVAVTIDDMPMAGGSPSPGGLETLERVNRRIVEALGAHNAPAIAFVNESRFHVEGQLDARVAVARAWVEAGLELGNHSFSHKDFQTTPLPAFQDEIIHGEVITTRVLGKRPGHFRFPYNHTGASPEAKASIEAFLTDRGYSVTPFTVEHVDYAFDRVWTDAVDRGDAELAESTLQAYLEHLDTAFDYAESFSLELFGREISQIFLIHVNRVNAEALDGMLARLKRRGYQFVSLDEALEDPAYRTPDTYVGPWGVSWLHRWWVGQGHEPRMDEPDPPRFIIDRYREVTRK